MYNKHITTVESIIDTMMVKGRLPKVDYIVSETSYAFKKTLQISFFNLKTSKVDRKDFINIKMDIHKQLNNQYEHLILTCYPFQHNSKQENTVIEYITRV